MPSKQRIAFVANTSWSIYKFRLYLLEALAKKGFDVFVLAPKDDYTHFFENISGVIFIELKKLKSKSLSPLHDIQLYKELLQHYKQIQPQLIFHYTIKANVYGSLAAAKTQTTAVSIITGLGYMFSGKSFLQLAASRLYRYALKKTKEVWFLNQDDKNVFVKGNLVTPGKTFLLPGEGVDCNRFYPAPYQYKKKVSFLLIGRMIAHKGIYEYVAAAKMLLAKGIDAEFCLLGFFDDKSAVAISKKQVMEWQAESIINYLGATDNVVPYIEKADCIVLPSYREGLPLSLLEASSMCKAIIASDVAGCREVVREDVNGFLVPVKNTIALANKMEQYYLLAPDKKTSMGLAGREIIKQRFTKEIISDIYFAKVKTLMA